MFKNTFIYRITEGWTPDDFEIETKLNGQVFAPCGPTQEISMGWVPPRGEAHGLLCEVIGGQRIMKFVIETKTVPGPVIKRRLDERVAQIEQTEGRKPGRKESRDLRDQIAHELLPHAFPKVSHVLVWLDMKARRLVLDTTSQSKADEVITALVRAFDGLQIAALNTQMAPQAAMTMWICRDDEDLPEHFALGRHVELHSGDEMQSVVKFDRHHLDNDQMRLHISQGKLPVKLALDWDGRVSFVLTEGTALRKIEYLDGVFEGQQGDEGGFDADVAIVTGELSALITDLVEALGGELA
jgi:recombination associated protein RdgC